jgi:hypothetical protein
VVPALVPVVLALLGTLSAVFVPAPAGAAGILPPSNPSADIAPSSSNYLAAIDSARADEGVGPMAISPSVLGTLPMSEQIFAVLNEERIDRGEPPIEYMTSQLDAVAQNGADSASDPGLPPMLTGGASTTYGGAIWAGGYSNPLEADYFWMYEDGWGGSAAATTNEGCSPSSPSACWAHRDIVLHQFAGCPSGAPTLAMGAAYSPDSRVGSSMAAVLSSTCGGEPSDVTVTWGQVMDSVVLGPQTVGVATLSNGSGYWEVEGDGVVANFGTAQNYGSMAGQNLNAPIVGMAVTPNGGGYWLVASDGGIFTFGDAGFYGSAGAIHLNQPIVGMAPTSNGRGYWLVAADGGIFSYGDATYEGSMGATRLNQPIVGMADDPATGGYWLVAADGGIFSFNAPFLGSTGNIRLNQPIVGMESLSSGQGYRFVAADGGVFSFGQAGYAGSMGGQPLSAPMTSMASDEANGGYWMAGSDGSIFGFGGAAYYGRIDG